MGIYDTAEVWSVQDAFPSAFVLDPDLPIGGSGVLRDISIPSEIVGIDITYGALFRRLYESPEGQFLQGQPLRFSAHFGYEPKEAMAAELGFDVDPLKHNLITYFHVADLVAEQHSARRSDMDLYDVTVAQVAAGIHDMGESMLPSLIRRAGGVVGDIPYGEKTDEDRAIEAAVRGVLWQEYLSDLPSDFVNSIEGVISHSSAGTIAHELYELGHTIGAYRTGIAAGILALKNMLYSELLGPTAESSTRQRDANLSTLAYLVAHGNRQHLVPCSSKYEAVFRLLEMTDVLYHSIRIAFEPMSGKETIVGAKVE